MYFERYYIQHKKIDIDDDGLNKHVHGHSHGHSLHEENSSGHIPNYASNL